MPQDQESSSAPDDNEILRPIEEAKTLAELEEARLSLLGRKGWLKKRLGALGALPQEARAEEGRTLHRLQGLVLQAMEKKKEALEKAARAKDLQEEGLDITLPVPQSGMHSGRIHPISRAEEEMIEIFATLGFSLRQGPEIETDENNFTALNTPPDHPARQALDTFYFPSRGKKAPLLLRCHTSPVQVRAMRGGAPPFRFIAPGRVYRRDSDQTHTPMFHQIEGLVIDRDIHLGHLKWVLTEFLRAFFENDDVQIRFRPHFFPFTEPSLEADMSYRKEGGRILAGGDQWMEILGCGMVHPHVLEASNIDSKTWQGFAFGTGIDRLAMLKYGISDLRSMFDPRWDWLGYYGSSPLFVPTLSGGLSRRKGGAS